MKKLSVLFFALVLLLTPFSMVSQSKIERNKKKDKKVIVETNPSKSPIIPLPSKATTGIISLGFGDWEGGIKNGLPDGKGKLTFNTTHTVDRSSSFMANTGDYFIATYDSGCLISGKLYDSEGNLLKTIIP